MQEDLKHLLELSTVDKKVYELKQTKKDLPLRVQALKDSIGREKANLDRLQAGITDTEVKIKESQDAEVTETQALQESNKRLDNISTNREYDAIHLEIAAHKKNIGAAQANVLHYQQTLENLRKDLSQVEAEYLKVREANEPELERLTVELNGIEDRIADEAKLSAGPRSRISKKVLSMYDRVVLRRGTPHVIAAVNHTHRFCDVCSRTQTPQRIIEIAKKNALLTCESCGSIMVWREEVIESRSP
jgi:uncharacterized protein